MIIILLDVFDDKMIDTTACFSDNQLVVRRSTIMILKKQSGHTGLWTCMGPQIAFS